MSRKFSSEQFKVRFYLDRIESTDEFDKRKHKVSLIIIIIYKRLQGSLYIQSAFGPLFNLFDVPQTGNIFKDVEALIKVLEDQNAFARKIYEHIFDLYDTVISFIEPYPFLRMGIVL